MITEKVYRILPVDHVYIYSDFETLTGLLAELSDLLSLEGITNLTVAHVPRHPQRRYPYIRPKDR